MIPDIQVVMLHAVITIEDDMSKCTRRVPLKWVLAQPEYASLLEQIQHGLEDLIEEFDMLDKLSDGIGKTEDG